jgi:hypothetical protein
MNDLEKKQFINNFLDTLCYVDCMKHKLKINKLFYETLHISIVEEQAKKVFNLLRKDKDFKLDINKLYK